MAAEVHAVVSRRGRRGSGYALKELGGSLLRSALVIEDTSIMAQVLRAFVRGLNIVTRNTKLVLCSDIDEAVRSLSPLVVPPQPGADVRAELAAAIVQAREGYSPLRK